MADLEDIEIVDESAAKLDPSEYLSELPTNLISGVLGLMGFIVSALVGVIASNPGLVILTRAILAMVICAIVGRVLGAVGQVCVREFVTRYKSDRPKPAKPQALVDLDRAKEAHDSVMKSMKKAA
jgi:hypothetical protein